MNEYYEFRSKRIKELDETFEITHFYGDDYPENINVEVNKIINNEWKLNNLQSKIDKANELIERKLSTETYQHLKKLYDDIDSTEEIWEDYEFEDLLDILKEDK